MVEIIEEKKEKEKHLPILGELPIGTVIELNCETEAMVIHADVVDNKKTQGKRALLLINYSAGNTWLHMASGYADEVMRGDYIRIIGKLKRMVVE